MGRDDWRLPALPEVMFMMADARRTGGALLKGEQAAGEGVTQKVTWDMPGEVLSVWTADGADPYQWVVRLSDLQPYPAASEDPSVVHFVLPVAGDVVREFRFPQ